LIACLGWGSLIWDPKGLPVAGDWHPDGPQLPVEFARVSKDGRLTLVVTEGAPPVAVLWSRLSVPSLEDGIQALADREEIPRASIRHSIGVWNAERSSRHEEAGKIGGWASERDLAAAIWTALKPGFPDSRGRVPTCQEVLAHLRSLDGLARAGAEEYVRRTPTQVRTPYRAAIEQEFGWTPA